MVAGSTAEGRSQGHFFFRRFVVLGFFALGTAIALLFLFLAYELSDPDWQPTGRRLRNSIWGQVLLILPWWIRVTFFIGLAAAIFLVYALALFHAFDRKADFSIGPEGISRNFLFYVRKLSWPEVQSVTLQEKAIKIVGSNLISRKTIEIIYDFMFFGTKKAEVLELIRQYRPDLVTDEQIPSAEGE